MSPPTSLNAWVRDTAEREAHEATLRQSLAGRRIVGARYVELQYAAGPSWPAAGFDSLDWGLELDLDNGELWSCSWANPGDNYGLLANLGTPIASLLTPEANPAAWDVSERWQELGPVEITDVTPVWTRSVYGPPVDAAGKQVGVAYESDLCQITVILHSATRAAVLTLGAAELDGSYSHIAADNLAVFFSIADAAAAGVVLPDHPNAIG